MDEENTNIDNGTKGEQLPVEQQKKKILLAEDEQFLLRAYINKLEHEGFEVIPVTDGVSAIEKIRSEKPDLVLLDIIMPKKTGFEVLEEAKADQEISHIPIVVTSNLGQESDVKTALESGAADYLIKSNISTKDLIDKIHEHLSE